MYSLILYRFPLSLYYLLVSALLPFALHIVARNHTSTGQLYDAVIALVDRG